MFTSSHFAPLQNIYVVYDGRFYQSHITSSSSSSSSSSRDDNYKNIA